MSQSGMLLTLWQKDGAVPLAVRRQRPGREMTTDFVFAHQVQSTQLWWADLRRFIFTLPDEKFLFIRVDNASLSSPTLQRDDPLIPPLAQTTSPCLSRGNGAERGPAMSISKTFLVSQRAS